MREELRQKFLRQDLKLGAESTVCCQKKDGTKNKHSNLRGSDKVERLRLARKGVSNNGSLMNRLDQEQKKKKKLVHWGKRQNRGRTELTNAL